jgi:hypothetical protein
MGIVLANGKTVNEGDKFGKCTVVFAFRNRLGEPWAFLECECGRCKAQPTHRRTKTAEYVAWRAMLGRCYRTDDISYPNYGGRGITVCDRWRTSFENFLADMGERPSTNHSLDRKESNGNYEPDNCRWATKREQSQNRRSTNFIAWNGETHCVAEWARRLDISFHALEQRLKRGWTAERALTQPIQEKRQSKRRSTA